MKYDKIPSGINSEKEGVNSLLETAAAEARRISLAIQEVAGTTACKGVQITRLKAQQKLFPDCSYVLMGFSMNREGKVCALLAQQYILFGREATEDEIHDELLKLGFHPEMDGEYYTNGEYDIFDAVPNNVLVGIDGSLYFIDTIIYKSDEANLSVYKSQSPKYTKNE